MSTAYIADPTDKFKSKFTDSFVSYTISYLNTILSGELNGLAYTKEWANLPQNFLKGSAPMVDPIKTFL